LSVGLKSLDTYNNSGAKGAQASNIEALCDPQAAFWCLNGNIGILNDMGNIHVVSTVGEVIWSIRGWSSMRPIPAELPL
jgi:hypothetical protein